MIAGYSIQEFLALIREAYPNWDSFEDDRFIKEVTRPIRDVSSRFRSQLRKGDFRAFLSQGDYQGLVDLLEQFGRHSPLLWTGNAKSGDLAVLYAAQEANILWPFLEQLRALIYELRPSPDRLETFSDFCRSHDLPNKWSFATHFMFLLRPHAEAMIKPRMSRWFLQFMGMGDVYTSTPSADMYERYKKNCHGLLGELKSYGAKDLIDVHGMIATAYQVSQSRVDRLILEAQIDLDRPLSLQEDPPIYNVAKPSPKPKVQPTVSAADLAQTIGYSHETIHGWLDAIKRKKQAIFYGPPGTGKTFIATHIAQYLVSQGDGVIQTVQFHPSYDYADFMEGIRPQTTADGQLTFVNRPGLFVQFCDEVAARTGPSVLIIDEINRANLSQVFGELMYLLEYRSKQITLTGGRPFAIPDQLIILGTMNTADRSIALIDHALRRRFAFIHLPPEYGLLLRKLENESAIDGPALVKQLKKINDAIGDPHFYLGTSYFLGPELAKSLPQIWKMEIEPYLEELLNHQPEMLNPFRWDKISPKVIKASN